MNKLKYVVRILFTLLLILCIKELNAQEYSKKEIREVFEKSYKTIKDFNTLKYTLDYHHDKSYEKATHKKSTIVLKFKDDDEMGAFFNMHITYNDSTFKKVVYNGDSIQNKYIKGSQISKRIIDVKEEGYSYITGSDVNRLLYSNIFDPEAFKKFNSLFGRIFIGLFIEKVVMQDTIFDGQPCYKISIYSKHRDKLDYAQDAVDTYLIQKKSYLPIAYGSKGVWEGLKFKDIYKVEYNKINHQLSDSLFNISSQYNNEYSTEINNQKTQNSINLTKIMDKNIPLATKDSIVLSKQNGKIIILDFWYRNCPPCIKLMPDINKLYNEYKDIGVVVMGINDIDSKESVINYHTFKNYSYPSSYKNADNFSKLSGINAFPTTVIIGKNGEVIKIIEGYERDTYRKVSKIIDEAIDR